MKIQHWEIWLIAVVGLVIAAALFILPIKCFGQDTPPEPSEVQPEHNWVYGSVGQKDVDSLDDVITGDIVCQQKLDSGDWKLLPGGILMSEQKAHYFAQVKISYGELRLLYKVDIATWDAKLNVYKSELDSSQKMIEKLTKEKKRTWWEKNDFQIGIIVGVVVGVAITGALAVGVYKIIE